MSCTFPHQQPFFSPASGRFCGKILFRHMAIPEERFYVIGHPNPMTQKMLLLFLPEPSDNNKNSTLTLSVIPFGWPSFLSWEVHEPVGRPAIFLFSWLTASAYSYFTSPCSIFPPALYPSRPQLRQYNTFADSAQWLLPLPLCFSSQIFLNPPSIHLLSTEPLPPRQ